MPGPRLQIKNMSQPFKTQYLLFAVCTTLHFTMYVWVLYNSLYKKQLFVYARVTN